MMVRLAVIMGFLGLFRPVWAQDSIENALQFFENRVIEIASEMEQETDLDELADKLNEIIENPVKINCDTNEYEKLFWLNDFQLRNLRRYIADNGPMESVYEIQYIEGFTVRDAQLLAPFVSLENSNGKIAFTPGGAIRNGQHKLLLRSLRVLEKQKGYQGYYEGGPASVYARYSFNWKNRISFGFTGENDAGEALFKGSNRMGFDYHSFFVQVSPGKVIHSIILGDYRASFGQGLNIWSGSNFAKSVTLNSFAGGTGISRYTSTDENRFFRGAAVVLYLKPFKVSTWVSSHRIDGNILHPDSVNGGIPEISSLQTTGIHALTSEIKDEDAIKANVTGINVSWLKTRIELGITANYYKYSTLINPAMEDYNRYYFRGTSNYNLSFDYKWRIGKIMLSGEYAISQNGGMAQIHGFETFITPEIKVQFSGRNYGRNYQVMYGNAFGGNSRIANENGLYAGLECKPVKYFTFSGYVDVFQFPWLTYSADMPSSGRDFMGQIAFQNIERLEMYVQYRDKRKEMNDPESLSLTKSLENVRTERIRFRCRYLVNESIRITTGMEWSRYCPEFSSVSRGFLVSEDVEFTCRKIPLRTIIRYSLFDTDDYNSRIYVYENDLLYTFSVPAFYDEGFRTYIMCKYSPSGAIDFWVKFAVLEFANKEMIGSGMNEISGSQRTDLKLQMLFKF